MKNGYDFIFGLDDEDWPTFKQFTECHWIKGFELQRMMLIKDSPNVKVFWVLQPSLYMLENWCDGCVRRHSFINTNCSFTQHTQSPFEVGKLYNFKTKEHIKGNWVQDESRSEWRHTSVGIETWVIL